MNEICEKMIRNDHLGENMMGCSIAKSNFLDASYNPHRNREGEAIITHRYVPKSPPKNQSDEIDADIAELYYRLKIFVRNDEKKKESDQ